MYYVSIGVIVKNIINKCFKFWIMTSGDICIWEETIGADTLKQMRSRIIKIVISKVDVEISR